MIGILGGMGTRAGLDFCNKLAKLNVGKTDQNYPVFILYNKSNIPKRPENLNKAGEIVDIIIISPRISLKNTKRKNNLEKFEEKIITDIDLIFLMKNFFKSIVVTGTNGKSTTSK